MTINQLIRTDKFDSYLAYILLVFIGLGSVSLLLTFLSIFGMVKKNRPLSMFVAVLWVFSVAINLVIFVVLFLYYFVILPQLRPLLTHTFQRSPTLTGNLLDSIQSRYSCCGINNINDYTKLTIPKFPNSCCRMPNCSNENQTIDSNDETMFTRGCYPIIERYVQIELWTLVVITGVCALLQIFAIILMCILNERYKKMDENPNFTINQMITGTPINANSENNFQSSTKTLEEPVEITQI